MAQQTAVEWLVENLSLHNDVHFVTQNKRKIIEQAKAMEKEQIINAHSQGLFGEESNPTISAYSEQFYNETYNK